MEEFKEKYEELKNNPMYQKYCSVLEIKDKVIKKLQQENEELKIQLLEKKCSDKDIEYKEKIKLQKRIDKALGHLNLFIWEEQLSKYDTLKILTHTRDILKGENNE